MVNNLRWYYNDSFCSIMTYDNFKSVHPLPYRYKHVNYIIDYNIDYRYILCVYVVIGGQVLGTRDGRRARNSSFRVYDSINFHVFKKCILKKKPNPVSECCY